MNVLHSGSTVVEAYHIIARSDVNATKALYFLREDDRVLSRISSFISLPIVLYASGFVSWDVSLISLVELAWRSCACSWRTKRGSCVLWSPTSVSLSFTWVSAPALEAAVQITNFFECHTEMLLLMREFVSNYSTYGRWLNSLTAFWGFCSKLIALVTFGLTNISLPFEIRIFSSNKNI